MSITWSIALPLVGFVGFVLQFSLLYVSFIQVDTIAEWWGSTEEHKRFEAYYPYHNSNEYGYGKDGRPLHFDSYPLIEPSAITASFSPDAMVNYHLLVMEQAS